MRLNLGCGGDLIAGYVNVDLYNERADVRCDVTKLPYDNDSTDEVLASHVIEHFDFKEAFNVLKEWRRVLKVGGLLVVETPDFLGSCDLFVRSSEQQRVDLYGHFFATPWVPGQTHKFLYTESQLRWTLGETGFCDIVRTTPTHYIKEQPLSAHLRLETKKK